MSVKVEKRLVCDRCGRSVLMGSRELEGLGLEDLHPDWERIGGGDHLCPDCAPGYGSILKRQRAEREAYVRGV